MVTFRPKLARSSTKARVAANSSECTDGAFCMLVPDDDVGQSEVPVRVCIRCVVEVGCRRAKNFLTWRRCQRCTFRTLKLLLTNFILSSVL
jgi:hypothetical protein